MNTFIFDLSINNYEQELERKNRLETKSLGYLNFISIILAIISAFFVVFLTSKYNKINCYNQIFILLIHSLVVYIFLLCFVSIVVLLKSLKIKMMSKYLYEESTYRKLRIKCNEDFEKTISLQLIKFTNKNIKINNQTEEQIKLAYFFLTVIITSIGFLIFVIFLYAIVGGHYV